MVKKCAYCGKSYIVGKSTSCKGCGANLDVPNSATEPKYDQEALELARLDYEDKKRKTRGILIVLLTVILSPMVFLMLAAFVFILLEM